MRLPVPCTGNLKVVRLYPVLVAARAVIKEMSATISQAFCLVGEMKLQQQNRNSLKAGLPGKMKVREGR